MNKNISNNSNGVNFLTGFLGGAILAGGLSYLLMTKQGRKFGKIAIKLAEEYAEKGEDFIRDQKIEEKITEVIDRLKSGLFSDKKTLDIKK